MYIASDIHNKVALAVGGSDRSSREVSERAWISVTKVLTRGKGKGPDGGKTSRC